MNESTWFGRGTRFLSITACFLMMSLTVGCGDAGADDVATEDEIATVAAAIESEQSGTTSDADTMYVDAAPAPKAAPSWAHVRGPEFDGSVDTNGVWQAWDGKPKIAWQKQVGKGTASVVIADGIAYTVGNKNNTDTVYAFDAVSGQEKWTFDYPCNLAARQFEGGPGASPTYHDGRLFVVSHEGHVHALDAQTGKLLWKKHLVKDFNGQRIRWGFSASPLVIGDMVIIEPGGRGTSTVALNVKDGETVWKTGNDRAGYASAVPVTKDGKTLIATFKAKDLVLLDTAGKEVWRYPWETSYDVNATSPIVVGDLLFIGSGYGTGCALVKIGEDKPVWQNKNLRPQVTQPAYKDGIIYGFDGQVGPRAQLVAIDLKTGGKKWSQRGLGAGTLIIADDKIIALSERGELLVGDATPERFRPTAKGQVLSGRCWVTPAIAGGMIYVRSNDGHVAAIDARK